MAGRVFLFLTSAICICICICMYMCLVYVNQATSTALPSTASHRKAGAGHAQGEETLRSLALSAPRLSYVSRGGDCYTGKKKKEEKKERKKKKEKRKSKFPHDFACVALMWGRQVALFNGPYLYNIWLVPKVLRGHWQARRTQVDQDCKGGDTPRRGRERGGNEHSTVLLFNVYIHIHYVVLD